MCPQEVFGRVLGDEPCSSLGCCEVNALRAAVFVGGVPGQVRYRLVGIKYTRKQGDIRWLRLRRAYVDDDRRLGAPGQLDAGSRALEPSASGTKHQAGKPRRFSFD